MEKFSKGNVVKLGINIMIVANTDSKLCHWISFDSQNCGGITSWEDTSYQQECGDCYGTGQDCDCNNGFINKTNKGMKHAKLLGISVKDYIIERLLKNFNF